MDGVFIHWFENLAETPEKTSDDAVINNTISQGVAVTSSAIQPIGSYNLETNAALAFVVEFTVAPMKMVGDQITVYVPYELSMNDNSYAGDKFTLDVSTMGSDDDWGLVEVDSSSKNVITAIAGGGSDSVKLSLSVQFAGQTNLPEGDYEGSIIAKITAP